LPRMRCHGAKTDQQFGAYTRRSNLGDGSLPP
jgi:hypothetical protein